MCQGADGELGGVQIIGVVFEYLDDGGGVKRNLLAYIAASVVGDGGESPESEMTRIILLDKREDFRQKTFR